ncbi:helix-turn-helix domain-containing protein [Acidipropionibacterium timonense]|uniref:helix-turn-helix domain-containing protein n=1 Tax=Acidipropionibacterium timonense TaxID=2161818 RepID=UPI00103263F7|nr:helix-turn-helix domain-containing protein [Acidipropionibacterium timonense]
MSRSSTPSRTVLPPQDLEEMLELATFLEHSHAPAALIGPDGQTVPLPLEAFKVLKDAAHAMREGRAITIAPVDQLLTTQQAADFLGISRPTLVKLLEQGRIAFQRPGAGRHRRVRLVDLLDYRAEASTERRATLDALTSEAMELGLYDATEDR